MTALIDFLNTVLWGYILVYGLLAGGVYLTLRLRLVQVLQFGEMIRCTLKGGSPEAGGITPFQALCTSLASRVGTGNIAGVAMAVVLGGPGAVFWMWMVALLGMATAFAEAALAQLYKSRNTDGGSEGSLFRGGPAFYIARGLGLPWLGTIFAGILVLALGLVMNALQSSAITDAVEGAFGLPRAVTGLAVALLTGLVIFGGVRKTAQVSEYIVPFMAGAYLLVTLAVMAMHLSELPALLWLIVSSAFGFGEVAAGIAGGVTAAMLNGVKRGIFSNEAGMGTAPNIAAAATARPHHPAAQGFVQAFAVFIDTIIVCTCTAMIILLSGAYVPGGELTGTQLTQAALAEHIGSTGPAFIALALFFFAFTTILGSYAYAEMAMTYLGLGSKAWLTLLRALALVMVFWGSLQTIQAMFNMADAGLALMAMINFCAVLALSGKVSALARDYLRQKRAGKEPRFILADHPKLAKGVEPDIWQ